MTKEMAPEKKEKKRKAAPTTTSSAPVPPAKKTKKVEDSMPKSSGKVTRSILKKKESTATSNDPLTPTANGNDNPKKVIKPRKRAVDFLSDEEDLEATLTDKLDAGEERTKESTKKGKPGKSETVKSTTAQRKKTQPSKPPVKEIAVPEVDQDDGSEGQDEGEEDQTDELLKGFESSGDEDVSGDEGFDPDAPVPRIPDSKKAKRKIANRKKKADEPEEPGTIYVGRIPHGFYEHQMRAYFSQFGEITRLRLSRNRTTGRSKHYAFLEFASNTVAKIVAETMDNYLLYGHILKCKYLPQDQIHPELWKGSNRRYKIIPWNTVERNRLAGGKSREKWEKKIQQEQQRRLKKAEKLKTLGYAFELPKLKAVEDVPLPQTS